MVIWTNTHNMDESKKHRVKDAWHKGGHTIWFHLHEDENKAKLTYKYQNTGAYKGRKLTRREHNGAFWSERNVLYCDWGAGYISLSKLNELYT